MQRSDIPERLLQAAREAFLTTGYQVSVDEIAQRAGIAKQTLYNHFKSKERLFAAVIRQAVVPATESLGAPAPTLRERLVQFGRTLRSHALSDEGLALYRLVVSEAPRFPAEAELMWAAGAGAVHERLTAVLREAQAADKLHAPSAEFAADVLLSMLLAFDRLRPLYGLPHAEEAPAARTEQIVDAFLRAFDGVDCVLSTAPAGGPDPQPIRIPPAP